MKLWKVLLCVLFCALTALCFAAEEKLISSDAELTALLTQCVEEKADETEFTCTEEYYAVLSENNFAHLTPLMWDAGVEDSYVRYNSSYYIVHMSGFVYGKVDYACVATMEEAENAVAAFAEKKAEKFNLVCASEELFDELFYNRGLYACAGMAGIEDLYMSGKGNVCLITDVEYIEVPWKLVTDAQTFLDAIVFFSETEEENFYLCFTPESYTKLVADNAEYKRLVSLSRLERYGYRGSSYFHNVEYYSATYTYAQKLVCENEDAIVDAIRAMGASGTKAFTLLLNEELYERVKAGQYMFTRLHELETEAGMTDSAMSYSYSSYMLYYTDAEIEANAVKLTTVGEADAHMKAAAENGDSVIYLFCTPGLYAELTEGWDRWSIVGNGMVPLYDLIAQNGIFHYTCSMSGETGLITLNVDAYYPGTNILCALGNGDLSALTQREVQTCEAARAAAEACRRSTPLETALAVHDYLCAGTVYTKDDSTDEDDCAIGALLNGQANCDGYADAFYLVGTLAGLEVRYQHGDSVEKGLFDFSRATHLWNLLKLDGTWRLVDVTWDDGDGAPDYTWFNLGYDRAARSHKWNEKMTVALAPETDLSVRPENEYIVSDRQELNAAMADATQKGFTRFVVFFTDEAFAQQHIEVLGDLYRQARSVESFSYSWSDAMSMLIFTEIVY